MSTKHTPGPWAISPRVSTLVVAANDRGICTTGGYSNNQIDPEILFQENEANARLIASAPAMFEALKAREEAERAQERYRKDSLNPPCGLNAEEAHNNWSIHLSDLAQEAFELTAKAKALRNAALAQAEPAEALRLAGEEV